MLSIRVSNVYDRKRLWIINSSVHAYASRGKRECKCPDVRKQLRVWSEYSGRRVGSPLVDLTAWHKKSALVIRPLHRTRLTITDVWRADYCVKQTPRDIFYCRFHTTKDRTLGRSGGCWALMSPNFNCHQKQLQILIKAQSSLWQLISQKSWNEEAPCVKNLGCLPILFHQSLKLCSLVCSRFALGEGRAGRRERSWLCAVLLTERSWTAVLSAFLLINTSVASPQERCSGGDGLWPTWFWSENSSVHGWWWWWWWLWWCVCMCVCGHTCSGCGYIEFRDKNKIHIFLKGFSRRVKRGRFLCWGDDHCSTIELKVF